LCDRWFGYFMESMRVMGLLENTMVVFTADHGHSIGDRNYLGKRGYPSAPEVVEVPIMVRHPEGKGAGKQSDRMTCHTDISAEILNIAGAELSDSLHGRPFVDNAIAGKPGRDHVTVAWGSAVTVITKQWWMNCKVDGTGYLLYDLDSEDPFARNVADDNPGVVKKLFETAKKDAEGGYPEWLVDLARNQTDAPGCSDLAARK